MLCYAFFVVLHECKFCRKSLAETQTSISYCHDLCKSRYEIRSKAFKRNGKYVDARGAEFKKQRKITTRNIKESKRIRRAQRLINLKNEVKRLESLVQGKPTNTNVSVVPIQKISFYQTREWRELRYRVIKKFGRKCQACGVTDKLIHIDHIKPRSKFPQLSLVESNLQVLCEDCNLGKSNTDETDWRPS